MTSHNAPSHGLNAEPDEPELKFAKHFLIAVTVFVAASLFGLKGWLNNQINPPADDAAETRR